MDPLRTADQLRTDCLQFPTTTPAPRRVRLKCDFCAAVERGGLRSCEPFVALTLRYRKVPTLSELLPDTIDARNPEARSTRS
jgi:hypothetical protein